MLKDREMSASKLIEKTGLIKANLSQHNSVLRSNIFLGDFLLDILPPLIYVGLILKQILIISLVSIHEKEVYRFDDRIAQINSSKGGEK